jgi:hypothetical protein
MLKWDFTLAAASLCALIALYNLHIASWAVEPIGAVRFLVFSTFTVGLVRMWWRRRRENDTAGDARLNKFYAGLEERNRRQHI